MAKGVPALHPEEKGRLNISPRKNYVEKRGGLPPYLNAVAVALVRKGMTRSRAIATAVNVMKKTCATGLWGGHAGEKVSTAIRAASCQAVAQWEKLKVSTSIPNDERAAVELAKLWDGESVDLAWPQEENWIKGAGTKPRLTGRLADLARQIIFGPPIDLAPSTMERKRAESKNQAMPGGRFPIRNASDLDKAIRAVGRARPNTEEERRKVRRFIRRRAQALGLTSRLPDNWKADGSLG